ncbi:MAG: methyltransferase protein [Microvirga sp.]|jgi:SAM-dependent methyltransferase|nr:methyltransferase protein [Microvirga sp.]
MKHLALYDLPPLYDLIVQPGPCERFYRDLANRVAGSVLELACGTGRLTIPLALDGHEIVGLDKSHAMLRSAREKADAERVEITFVHGDMRRFKLDRRFSVVIISCNSLAHLTTNEELKSCLRSVAKHLVPGGLVAFDIVNPNLRELLRPETQSVRLDVGPNPSAAVAVEEIATYDPVQQIRVAQWRILDKTDRSREIAPLALRVVYPQEVSLLLDAAGFELAARYGDFDCNPLSSQSLNQICLARAPEFSLERH